MAQGQQGQGKESQESRRFRCGGGAARFRRLAPVVAGVRQLVGWKEGRKEGRKKGRKEGRKEGRKDRQRREGGGGAPMGKTAVRAALEQANLAVYAKFFEAEGYEEIGDLPRSESGWQTLAEAASVKRGHQNRWQLFAQRYCAASLRAGVDTLQVAQSASCPRVEEPGAPRPLKRQALGNTTKSDENYSGAGGPPSILGSLDRYVMLSYQWDMQQTVLRVRQALEKRGVVALMDVDGSMANDVSKLQAVVCRSCCICRWVQASG